MIQRILVALDVDSDTPIATRYAVAIAQPAQAEVIGLAVVDLKHIEDELRGGGIGSMYYAEKLRANLTTETRAEAERLTAAFEAALEGTGVPFGDYVKEGVPYQRIIEDMKYHDLLVVGRTPHFFYGSPNHKTETLARVVKTAVSPTFVVGEAYNPVHKVLVAYDGSDAAARTLQSFALLKPFGTEVEVAIISVYAGEAEKSEVELQLRLAKSYLRAHGYKPSFEALQAPKPAAAILGYAEEMGADVMVAGAHAVSKLRKLAFGSTTAELLRACPIPLFLHH